MAVHNRLLPAWVHRVANGAMAAALLGGLGSLGYSWFGGTTLAGVICKWCVLLAVPIGMAWAVLVTGRVSLVEGVGGDAGYDELVPPGGEQQ
jgi:hypothetical protein